MLRKTIIIEDRPSLDVSCSASESPQLRQSNSREAGSPPRIVYSVEVDTSRRCDVVEKRCDEVVRILNRKAYKSDVTRALSSLERALKQFYQEGDQGVRVSYIYICLCVEVTFTPGEHATRLAPEHQLTQIERSSKAMSDMTESRATAHSTGDRDVRTRMSAIEAHLRHNSLENSICGVRGTSHSS